MKYSLPGGKSITPITRRFEARREENFIRISGSHNRLVEPGIFNAGLDEAGIEMAKNNALKNHQDSPNPISKDYLDVPGRNPVFVILPIVIIVNEEFLTNFSPP